MTIDTLSFFVPGPPVPFTRVLRGERSKRAAKYRAYRAEVALRAKEAGAEPIDGPVWLSVAVFLVKPEKRTYDLDNCYKGCADALNAIAYHDDRQIIRGEFGIYPADFGLPEGVNVIVRSLNEESA